MLPYTSSAVFGPESSSKAESVVQAGQRGVSGRNDDLEGDGSETCCRAEVDESCGVWTEELVALLLGSREEYDWLRKSVEGEELEPVCGRSALGRTNGVSSYIVGALRTPVKGDVRKLLGSEGKREPLGPPDQEVAYSDGAVKGRVEGGGVEDEWESEGGLPS